MSSLLLFVSHVGGFVSTLFARTILTIWVYCNQLSRRGFGGNVEFCFDGSVFSQSGAVDFPSPKSPRMVVMIQIKNIITATKCAFLEKLLCDLCLFKVKNFL